MSWEREELDVVVEHALQSGVFPVSDLAVERKPQRRLGSGSVVCRNRRLCHEVGGSFGRCCNTSLAPADSGRAGD